MDQLSSGPPTTALARGLDAFRAAVNASFVPLDVQSRHPGRFRGVIGSVVAGGVALTDLRADDHDVHRTPDLLSRGDDPYLKVSMLLAGQGLLLQDGRESVLHPGAFAVYDTSRPYTLTFDGAFRSLVVMHPRRQVAVPDDLLGEITATSLTTQRGPGALVAPFLRGLADRLDQVRGAAGARLAHAAVDLVTAVLIHELAVDLSASDALHARVLSYIDQHLADPGLSPSSIAQAHHVSLRHLHAVFHEHGGTVGAHIRRQRLERAREDLEDPLLAALPVAAIGRRWGFADAAHFSKTFRQAYGVPPAEHRRRVG